jgi:O-antigen/teichoic acid export membrane protein
VHSDAAMPREHPAPPSVGGRQPGLSSSVIANSFTTLVLRAASFGIRVLCILVVARKAGPALFGTISIFFTMAEIGRVVADCGVDTSMLRNMATERGAALARSMGAAISAKLLTGSVVAVVLVAAMSRFDASPALILSVALLALTPLGVNLGANYFIATQRTAAVGLPVTALTIVALVAFATATILSAGPLPLILVVAGYEVVLGGWLVWRALQVAAISPVLSTRGALGLVGTALPLGVAIAVGYSYGKLDVFILDHFCGREAVGQYSVWSRLLDPFLFLCGVISVTAYGHVSAAMHQGDLERTRSVARRYALLNLSVAGAAAALLAIAGPPLAHRFLPRYEASIWIGQLLAALLVLRSINTILTAVLQAAARRKLIMLISFGNFAVALVACVALAQVAGIIGVVCGLVIMESINFGLQATFARRELFPDARPAHGT